MKERRINNIEVRKNENDEEMVIEGKAVAFESPATYYGETEIIDKNAFKGCDMKDVVLRYNHNDSQYTLARTRNKSLKLDIRDDGLYFTANLIPTQTNKDAYLMVKEGLLDKCSFAFADFEYDYDEDTRTTRITSIKKMFDVAIVDFPYYEETSVVARKLDTGEEMHKKQAQQRRRKALARKLAKELLLSRL